ncbi:MAG: phage tail protein [Blautia sp.]|nr:phage tail protein [Blautia sp.]
MAQVFNNAVVTDAGVNLIAACEAAGDPIVFTRVVTGDGVHTDKTPAALKVRTALINQKQSVSLSSKRAVANACKITAVISNVTLVTGYYMNELGLYAQQGSDSSTEVLFNIAVVAASQGDWFPPYNGTSPAEIVQSFVISSANDLVVQIALESDSYALKSELGDLDDLDTSDKDNIVKAINEIADKFDSEDGTLKVQYGGTWSKTSDLALQTLGAQASRAITEVINQPDTLLIPVNGGRYFGHQNKLYRASEGKIAAGSTITPEGAGKNCEEVELSDEVARKASVKSITDNVEHEFKCTAADGYDTGDRVYIECADQRYKVTAPIAYNETMSTSTNLEKASVDDDLSSISSDLTSLTTGFRSRFLTTSLDPDNTTTIQQLLANITFQAGTEIINVYSTARAGGLYMLTIIMQNVNNNYGHGIAFGYYVGHVYKIENVGRTFDVIQIS